MSSHDNKSLNGMAESSSDREQNQQQRVSKWPELSSSNPPNGQPTDAMFSGYASTSTDHNHDFSPYNYNRPVGIESSNGIDESNKVNEQEIDRSDYTLEIYSEFDQEDEISEILDDQFDLDGYSYEHENQNGSDSVMSEQQENIELQPSSSRQNIESTVDVYLTPEYFRCANQEVSEFDKDVDRAIHQKLDLMTPTAAQKGELDSLFNWVLLVLNKMIVPGSAEGSRIEAIIPIGSYQMGIMFKNNLVADLVIILRTLPFKSTIEGMGKKIMEDMARINNTTHSYFVEFTDDHLNVTDRMFAGKVTIHFTTNPNNFELLSTELHIKKETAKRNLLAIEHAKWFEDNVRPKAELIDLIRIFKHMAKRYKDFRPMSPWMVIILCHYAMCKTFTGTPLKLAIAFKRILQLLSSGMFLPYTPGIPDPVDTTMPIHGRLTVDQCETITVCAKTLLRLFSLDKAIFWLLELYTGSKVEAKTTGRGSHNNNRGVFRGRGQAGWRGSQTGWRGRPPMNRGGPSVGWRGPRVEGRGSSMSNRGPRMGFRGPPPNKYRRY